MSFKSSRCAKHYQDCVFISRHYFDLRNLFIRAFHTVTIVEVNAPPRVDLEVRQQGAAARVVYTDDGLVDVIADVTDPDARDRHGFDWSETDKRLFDTGTVALIPSFLVRSFWLKAFIR